MHLRATRLPSTYTTKLKFQAMYSTDTGSMYDAEDRLIEL